MQYGCFSGRVCGIVDILYAKCYNRRQYCSKKFDVKGVSYETEKGKEGPAF